RAGGEVVVAADDARAEGRGPRRQVHDGAAGPQLGEAQLAPVPGVVLEALAERGGGTAHAVVEDRVVPFGLAALGTCPQGVLARLRLGLVALTGDAGEGPADLLVRALQHQVAYLHGVLGAAGNDLILLDDRRGRWRRLAGRQRGQQEEAQATGPRETGGR